MLGLCGRHLSWCPVTLYNFTGLRFMWQTLLLVSSDTVQFYWLTVYVADTSLVVQ